MPTHPPTPTHYIRTAQPAAGELSSSSRYNPRPPPVRRPQQRSIIYNIQFVACAFTLSSVLPGAADSGAVDLEPGSAPYTYAIQYSSMGWVLLKSPLLPSYIPMYTADDAAAAVDCNPAPHASAINSRTGR